MMTFPPQQIICRGWFPEDLCLKVTLSVLFNSDVQEGYGVIIDLIGEFQAHIIHIERAYEFLKGSFRAAP